jgi:TonB family protein
MSAIPRPSSELDAGSEVPVAVRPQHTAQEWNASLATLRLTTLGLQFELAPSLQMVVEQTMFLAGAMGAAIALKQEQAIVCCASAGAAPAVGAELQPDQGLSGECVRTGRIILCSDTETDSRVDAAVCQALGFRSALIVPICSEQETLGILELLAEKPQHFQPGDISALKEVAAFVVELQAEGTRRNTPLEESQLSASAGDEFIPDFDLGEVVSQLGLEGREAAETATASETPGVPDAIASLFEEESDAGKLDVAPLAEKVVATHTATLPSTSAAAQSPRAAIEQESANRRFVVIFVGLLLSGLIAALAWILWNGRHRSPAQISPAGALQPSIQAAGDAPSSASKAAPSSTIEVQSSNEGRAPAAVSGGAQTSTQNPSVRRTGAPYQSRLLQPRSAGLSLSRSSSDTGDTEAAPNVPAVPVGPQNAAVALPLDLPGSMPVLERRRISSALTPGALIRQVKPIYPDLARRNGIEGDVILKFTVTKAGAVKDVKVVEGDQTLAPAAVQAVRQWRYRPFLLDGQPVEAESQATIKFTVPR